MADVARAAGVHQGTVSRALHNHPRLPEATRRRIRELAERMGYEPNPLVAALMSTRRRRGGGEATGSVLALLTTGKSRSHWREGSVQYAALHRSILSHARARGYGAEEFWLDEPGMSAGRLGQILVHRGIGGVVVCPLVGMRHRVDFDFGPFAAVAMGNTLREPILDHVAIDYSAAMKRIVEQLHGEGFRRLAFISPTTISDRVGHLSLGAFLAERHFSPDTMLAPLALEDSPAREQVLAWIAAMRPDAVITPTQAVYDALRAWLGHGVETPALLCADCHLDSEARGMCRDVEAEAKALVELLTQRVERGIRGLPSHPQTILIGGRWHAGVK